MTEHDSDNNDPRPDEEATSSAPLESESPANPRDRWSSAALAADDQRRVQELMLQRRFPVRTRREQRKGKDKSGATANPDAARSRTWSLAIGIGVLALTFSALAVGMTVRGAIDGNDDDGRGSGTAAISPQSGIGQSGNASAPVTVPVIVPIVRPGTPKVCKLPDERSEQSDALYNGTDVNRLLLPYSPFRLINYPCSNLSGNIRMVLLYRDAIVMLQGGKVVRAIPFDATKNVTLRQISAAVKDSTWISEVAGGVFQVDTAFVQLEGTTMTLAAPDMKELRLTSRQHVFLGGRGARMTIDGIKVTSWDAERGGPDLDPADGRPYILYERGSRLDINKSVITYLGSDRSGAYGTSWRTGGTTGSAIDSEFSHNWFGVYTFEARDIIFRGDKFIDNDLYGLDPHDYSYRLTVENNIASGNGSHGLIFSRGVVDSVMRNNHVFDNGGNGIVLDLGSNNNVIDNNVVENNKKDGIVLIGSGDSTISHNTVRGNRTGIRLNDPGTRNVEVSSNLVEGNRTGIHVYGGAGNVNLTDNAVRSTTGTGVIAEGSIVVRNLEVTGARTGIDSRAPVDLQGIRVDQVDVGLLARDRGVIDARDVSVTANQIGMRLLPGTSGTVGAGVVLEAPEQLKATSHALQWRHLLPYVGLGAIGLAITLEVLRGSRTRGEWARLAPAGVTNLR